MTAAATGVRIPRDKISTPYYRPEGALVTASQTFSQGWMLMRAAAGTLQVATEVQGLLSGGFADRDITDSTGSYERVNAETGIYSVYMSVLAGDTFLATDGPLPLYAINNHDFGKLATNPSTGAQRSICGLYLHLDPQNSLHCIADVSPEGVAAGKALAQVAAVAGSGAFLTDEATAPSATSTTALKTATAMSADPKTVLAAELTAAGGTTALAAYPRNITITGGGTTGQCPTSVLITGTDYNGNVLTETLALSSGSGTGVKAFKTLVSLVFSGATTTFQGTCAIGIGSKLGFTHTVKVRANKANVINEVYDASGSSGSFVAPSTATIVTALTSPPHGTWTPASAPDGTKNFALTYEQDLS